MKVYPRNVFFLLILLNFLTRVAEALGKPSIILFLNDDQGFGEGVDSTKLNMPNLKRLAAEGMILNRTYTRTVCAPSRWAIFMGNNAVRDNGLDGTIATPNTTLAGELKKQGYKTAIFGKWGFGKNNTISSVIKSGFDESLVYTTHIAAHNTFPQSLEENGVQIDYSINRLATIRRCLTNKCTYGPDLFLDKAYKFIEANYKVPYFLALTLNLPHVGLYQNVKRYAMTSPVPSCGTVKCNIQKFALSGHRAMLENYIDGAVGMILDTLERLNVSQNTIILYTSDNGAPNILNLVPRFNSNGDLKGFKGSQYEGAVRVPGLAWGPGRIPAGTVSNYPIDMQNLLPTLTEFAGQKIITPTSFLSYFKLWAKGDAYAPSIPRVPVNLELCRNNIDSNCAYAYYDLNSWPQKVFKLLDDRKGLGEELYDVMNDPNEKINLAKLPQYNNTITTMRTERLKNRIPLQKHNAAPSLGL